MPATPSYKSSASNLRLPDSAGDATERRRPYRVPPPPAPLNIPEPVDARRNMQRPPSPLRNSYTPDHPSDEESEDGSDDDRDDAASAERSWSQRSHSPSPSLTKFATNIAQRVGALVGGTGSLNSPGLPTEAEIEAEAEREKERSKREAEIIMRREEEERKMVEDGVFALLESTSQAHALPPPPARSQTMASNPPSPSSSQKEKESWFAAVKNKLTPTKEPLTPAQQIIQETKAKDKERRKSKDKEKDKDWPSTPARKYSDPAFMKLASSAASPEHVTPPRPIGQSSPAMTPSPKRSVDSSRDAPPLYAQFNSQGTLDVASTLLTVARRFEKLERWTVSHVRALEDRMGDVERWLVDKEKEKDDAPPPSSNSEKSSFHSDEDHVGRENDLNEIRDELIELQGRVGELGREMAKLMTAPPNLTSGPARNTTVSYPSPAVPPTPTSMGPRSLPTLPVSTPRQPVSAPIRPKETSPPPSSVISTGSSRTRLPYPTGDYTSPPGAIPTKQDILSPTNSPPSSLTEATRRRPMSISGLPSASSSFFQSAHSSSGLATPGLPRPQETSPARALSPSSMSSKLPSPASQRQSNVSPTPRKRYTVALGAPITGLGAPEPDEYDSRQRNAFSTSPVSTEADSSDAYEDGDAEARAIGHSRDDTIGKSDIRLVNPPTMPNDTLRRANSTTTSPRTSPGTMRTRAQSSYGPPSGFSMISASPSPSSSPSPITPLRLRVRSKSIDRIGLGLSAPNANGNFVDPLLIRKQEQDALQPKTLRTPKYERGKGKVPIGELVAFFDKDKR
ncbi:hypothetical protein M0805_007213 [Coniferiporia weirii]|nr:hypothetical protein M0805_007213 [Coniferiporia weirii]